MERGFDSGGRESDKRKTTWGMHQATIDDGFSDDLSELRETRWGHDQLEKVKGTTAKKSGGELGEGLGVPRKKVVSGGPGTKHSQSIWDGQKRLGGKTGACQRGGGREGGR